MPFSREKFQGLAPRNQAKKLSDLIALFLKEGRAESLDELRLLASFRDPLLDIPESPTPHFLTELYSSLRSEAGLGFEQSVADALAGASADRESPRFAPLPWWVCLHNGRSAFNAGSVIRTADCFGFSGVLLSGYAAKIDNRSLKSAAMGAEEWLPVQYATDPGEWLMERSGEGMRVVALETTSDAVPIEEFSWPSSGLLLLGNEELGLPPELLDRADAKVRIPLYGRKGSLNLANAFAVAAWEIRRTYEA